MELSVIITIIGVLVALTNIVVQVLKTSTYEKLPTNLLALIVAEVRSRWPGIWSRPWSSPALWWLTRLCSALTSSRKLWTGVTGNDFPLGPARAQA